jgi:hypothetical protein
MREAPGDVACARQVIGNDPEAHGAIIRLHGVLFTSWNHEPIARLAGWFYRGQTPFGQFFRQRETIDGFQFILELRPAIRSLITRQH